MKDTTGIESGISPASAIGAGHAAGPGDVPPLPPFGNDAERFEQWLSGFEKAAKKRGGSDADKVLRCVAALRQRKETSPEDIARAGYLLAMWHFQTVRDHFIEHETERRDAPLRTLYQRLKVAIGRSEAGSVKGKELLAVLDVHVKPSKLETILDESKLDNQLLEFLKVHADYKDRNQREKGERSRGPTADLLGVRVSADNEGAFLLDGVRHTRESISQMTSRRKKAAGKKSV